MTIHRAQSISIVTIIASTWNSADIHDVARKDRVRLFVDRSLFELHWYSDCYLYLSFSILYISVCRALFHSLTLQYIFNTLIGFTLFNNGQ